MNENERKLIIELLKFTENKEEITYLMKDENINWIKILGFISYHRIAGFVFQKINNINIRLFEFPVFFSTFMINQSQCTRNQYQFNEIKIIANSFNKNDVEYIFLKGAILNQYIFKNGARASNDIDILINKKNIKKASTILYSLGYTQGIYNSITDNIIPFKNSDLNISLKTRGETCPFVKVVNEPALKTIDVDLNFSLDWTANYNQKLIDRVLKNRKKIVFNETDYIYFASFEDNIIELCTHLYKDMALLDIVKKRKVFDLYKLLDIYYFFNIYYDEVNFDDLMHNIELFNSEKPVYFALAYLVEIFDDFRKEKILVLMNWLKDKISNLDFLDTIFDQYNTNDIYITSITLKDRIFEYNIINKYKRKESDNEKCY